jgi:hypothetical protein
MADTGGPPLLSVSGCATVFTRLSWRPSLYYGESGSAAVRPTRDGVDLPGGADIGDRPVPADYDGDGKG